MTGRMDCKDHGGSGGGGGESEEEKEVKIMGSPVTRQSVRSSSLLEVPLTPLHKNVSMIGQQVFSYG